LTKLEQSFQIPTPELRNETQAPLCGVLLVITRRLGAQIKPFSDRMMAIFLKLFSSQDSSVHEEALLVIGALSSALGKDFERYAPHLRPFLGNSLKNYQDYHVCSVAVSIVSDMCSSLGVKMVPFCEDIVNALLQNLRAEELNRDVKPQILACFGDIALAIEVHFEKYFTVVMDMLIQAAQTKNTDPNDLDFVDWLNSLREGVLTAYTGILQGLAQGNKAGLLVPHIQNILQFIVLVWQDAQKTEEIISSVIGLLGDIAQHIAPQAAQIQQLIKHEQISKILSDASKSEDEAIVKTAQWAQDLIAEL